MAQFFYKKATVYASRKYDDRVKEIIAQLTELSKEMDHAVKAKDIVRIQEIHLQKQSLIDTLNTTINSLRREDK